MARREALMRITKTLVARRTELRKRLGGELDDLGTRTGITAGDEADAAFDQAGEEVASRLAMVEARELAQVEAALARIKQGKYGICAGCGGKIPVLRLNALPYATLCMPCQREAEKDSTWLEARTQNDWNRIPDSRSDDNDIDVSSLEYDLSK
jgi:DnaK suppressor protein